MRRSAVLNGFCAHRGCTVAHSSISVRRIQAGNTHRWEEIQQCSPAVTVPRGARCSQSCAVQNAAPKAREGAQRQTLPVCTRAL